MEISAQAPAGGAVLTIPSETTWSGTLKTGEARKLPGDDATRIEWVRSESAVNGLDLTGGHSWHIVIAFQHFDEDGDMVDQGTFDEKYAGPRHYKVSYASDKLNQTDFVGDSGIFRRGDQRFPDRTEKMVRDDVLEPFLYAATLEDFRLIHVERSFSGFSMPCVSFQRVSNGISGAAQYCFNVGDTALRYTRGSGWFQTTYNDIASFQGRNVARAVEVMDGGKPYLKLHVTTLEALSFVNATEFLAPSTAVGLRGKRVSGVAMQPLKQSFPEWPDSMRQEHFTVTVEMVVGKDGHVISAHATSGPAGAYKSAEKTARAWLFRPYLVGGEPVEVETKILLSNN